MGALGETDMSRASASQRSSDSEATSAMLRAGRPPAAARAAGFGAGSSWYSPSPRIPYSFSSLRSARRRMASGVRADSGASSRYLR